MRTTKKEREKNARQFYQTFVNGNCSKAAIVVKRTESSNPNINRCQFCVVISMMERPVIVAESTLGIAGCFHEFLGFLKPCLQKNYYDDGFDKWLKQNFGFEITYKDGLVFMLEK